MIKQIFCVILWNNHRLMPDKRAVNDYLKSLKQLIKTFGIVFLDERSKNSTQDLADIGITPILRKDIILSLEYEDYNSGPIEETQQGGFEYWVFGKIFRKTELYIKLTIAKETNIICISFHKAERPMDYPLKETS